MTLTVAELKRLCITGVLSFLILTVVSACVTVETVRPDRGAIEVTTEVTPAGINYSRAFMPDAAKVSLHVIWPNRWVHENKKAVAASLGVDLMSSGGAGSRSAKKIKQEITALGSAASLVTTPDHVYGTFTSTPQALPDTLAIIRDVISQPELSKQQFNSLQDALISRVESRRSQPSARLWSVSRRALIGDSYLTDYWNNVPVAKVVAPITVEDVGSWHSNTFVRKDVTVAIAGDITAERAASLIDQLLSALPETTSEVKKQNIEVKTGFTVLLHDEAVANTHIAVIGLLPPSSDGSEVADIVAVGALGKGKDSRLGVAQLGELPDVAPLSASIANFDRQTRVFGINAEVPDDSAKDTFELIEKTYKAFKLADLDDQDVLRSVVPFANSIRNNASKPDLIAYGLGQLLLDDLPKESLLTVMQDSLSLTAGDINQRITDHYPDWESLVRVVMTSSEDLIAADCVIREIDELSGCDF